MTDTLLPPPFDHGAPGLDACDREPIHIPGSIQPHGLLVLADVSGQTIRYVAGDIEGRLGVSEWQGQPLAVLLPETLRSTLAETAVGPTPAYLGRMSATGGEQFDVSVHAVQGLLAFELEPAPEKVVTSAAMLAGLEAAGLAFERSISLRALCERAALEYARLTGFDRVMIYRFLDDETGVVVAEALGEGVEGFLNHHFPGSDIPRQARALYVRNLVRVIPDSRYRPQPLRPGWSEAEPLDMSDCALRSVSPVHLKYLANMGVAASASISIVKDGVLWGLIACHHSTPRTLPYDVRIACRALAGGLARQIKAREDAEAYRERIRLRGFEDDILAGLGVERSLDETVAEQLPYLQRMMDADGVAIYRSGHLATAGETPNESDLREAVGWIVDRAVVEPVASDRWAEDDARAAPLRERASGLLAVTISADEPFVLMWFRAEQLQVVNWAGNPHKDGAAAGPLTPRASFDAWAETVQGRSRPWSLAQVEAASRLRAALLEARHGRRLRDLNSRLAETLSDRESLLQQKDFLLKEVNHRVQNSLQLVGSFLSLQGRASEDAAVREQLDEARRRLNAVALVHRRLYRADQMESVDLARYLEELSGEMLASMGPEWSEQVSLDLAPISLATDRAVTVGLVATELVINANKYAYGGGAGPVDIRLEAAGGSFRLIVADRGRGRGSPGQGFGTRMMTAMVSQLGGRIEYLDNDPGLRAVVTAPVDLSRG